jgi:hypothetical protein
MLELSVQERAITDPVFWQATQSKEEVHSLQELWKRLKPQSSASDSILTRINELMPQEPITDEILNHVYAMFHCDNAAFYAFGQIEEQNPGALSFFYHSLAAQGYKLPKIPSTHFDGTTKQLETLGFKEIEAPQQSGATLVLLEGHEIDHDGEEYYAYHFAVDLGIQNTSERFVFHKPGELPPTLTGLANVMDSYEYPHTSFWKKDTE